MRRLLAFSLVSAWFACLTSCGGGGPISGIDGSGSNLDVSITGPINGFGSVIVDGVRYDTDSATIYISGEPVEEDELSVGDYVTVIGTADSETNTGIAEHVFFQPNVTGPISDLNIVTQSFVILGQTIFVTEETSFDTKFKTKRLEDLNNGDYVTVSGPSDGTDGIVATRIREPKRNDFELAGYVSMLTETTLVINGLTVDFSQVNEELDIEDGTAIVVRGSNLEGNTLIAEKIRVREERGFQKRERKVEFKGFVSEYENNQFRIDGISVTIDGETEFENGDLASLENGQKIKLIAEYLDRRSVYAQKIEFEDTARSRFEGEITDIALGEEDRKGRVESAVISVNDTEITLTRRTRLEGKGSAIRGGRIQLSDLRLGDKVFIVGDTKDNVFIAKMLVVDRTDEMPNQGNKEARFVGKVKRVDASQNQFTLFGYTVVVSDSTEISDGEMDISAESLFADLEGRTVEVRGQKKQNRELSASRVKLIDEDSKRFKVKKR